MEWPVLIEGAVKAAAVMHLSPQQTLAAKQRRAGRREAGHVHDSGRVTLATLSCLRPGGQPVTRTLYFRKSLKSEGSNDETKLFA